MNVESIITAVIFPLYFENSHLKRNTKPVYRYLRFPTSANISVLKKSLKGSKIKKGLLHSG